jgi:pyruvate decarboxylase
MNKEISCVMAKLNDPREAAALIDDTLQKCWLLSRPVYIIFPTDMVQKKTTGEWLKTPIDSSFPTNDLAEKIM